MRHLISILAISVIIAAVSSCKKDDSNKTITVNSLVGDVKVAAGGAERTAVVGDVLAAGDTVRTGTDSIADILFGDAGIMRIQPGSSVSMASIMDPATGDTRLDMPEGTVTVTLSKLKKGTFSVKTPTAVASVRGTTFRFSAGQKASRLDVVTGVVAVSPVQNNAVVPEVEKAVSANQTVELDEKTVKEVVEKKKEIKVAELKPEDIKKIRDEVKDIKPEVLDKLNNEARQEIKEKILPPAETKDSKKEEKPVKGKEQTRKMPTGMKAAEEKAPEKTQPAIPKPENKQKGKPKDESGSSPASVNVF
ncbi:MAG: FecR domain-containing protein [Spirochaetes bacterium]|nr:FecR domain-containing protein [Spirochaetota bacterium]